MKKVIQPVTITLSIIIFIGLATFCGLLSGEIRSPADLTRSAQGAETVYAEVTAEIESISVELTKMASEPELTAIPTASVNSQNWPEHFIHSPTCQIPCWENINPNKTDINTATKIVARISGVKIIELDNRIITWYFDNKSSRIGSITANQEGIVIQIDLDLENSETLNLSDVIISYGNPNAVIEGMDCNHILSYRYQGMLLSAPDVSCSRNPTVNMTPTTRVDRIILFSPDNQEYTLSIFAFNMDEIIWDGYKTYDFTNQ